MVKYESDGATIDVERSSYTDIANHYAGVALERLLLLGGPGLRAAVLEAMQVAIAKKLREEPKDGPKEGKKASK